MTDKHYTLDIVLTHYKEPWTTGQKFFDMMLLQRGVDFSTMRVLIVQDGEEGSLDWSNVEGNYPFDVEIVTVPHGGISMARNAGIENSTADWVIFCDFDDMYASVYSLRKFYQRMDDSVDLIFCHIHGEEGVAGNNVETYMDNDVFIHGKMFRREFLVANGLRFEPGVTFSEDTLFCRVMNVVINPYRKAEIKEILYARCWYEGSVCRNYENNFNNAVGLFRARKALIREYRDHNCMKNYTATVVKTALDYYYAITSGGYPSPEWFEEDFWQFWQEYGEVFETAAIDIVMYENDISFNEAVHKGFQMIPTITFWEWLDRMRDKFAASGKTRTVVETRYPKIAVYHATRNKYHDMYAAMKSLILNSNVEKVYLLIEDDEFPYEVPDKVECINAAGQEYILPTSPNYNCCWTWMVMLRAAFPKIFPQHDVVLSLDIDTIVVRNIDDVWDTDLTDAYYAAAVEAKSSEFYGRVNTNMGVCLLNLAKLREDGMDDRILHELNTVQHSFTEQDVFNEFCQGHIAELSSDYNASAYTKHAVEEKIVHFAGFKQNDFPYMHCYREREWPKGMRIGKAKVRRLGEMMAEKPEPPMFSVVIPAYNSEKWIPRLLDSITAQTYTDYEIIVVCDSCEDRTEEIAKAYGAKTCAVDFCNDGLTRDRGVEMATGRWVLFADDDDWFRTDRAFEKLAASIDMLDDDVDVIGFGYMSRLEGHMHPSEVRMFVAGSAHVWSSCWKRDRIGDARFGKRVYCSDAYFIRDMQKNIRKFAMLDEPLYYYNLMRPGSQTDRLNKGELVKTQIPEEGEGVMG